jgi:hypothetical protein
MILESQVSCDDKHFLPFVVHMFGHVLLHVRGACSKCPTSLRFISLGPFIRHCVPSFLNASFKSVNEPINFHMVSKLKILSSNLDSIIYLNFN